LRRPGAFARAAPLVLRGWIFVLCGACTVLEPRPDRSRFFVLATAHELDSAEAGSAGIPIAAPGRHDPEAGVPREAAVGAANAPGPAESLGIGPIELPEYVLRSELVRRRGATEIVPARNERWSEPLESAVARVLAHNLARALDPAPVRIHPWFADAAPGRQVRIEFARFEGVERRRASVEVRWEIVETATRIVLESRTSRYEPPLLVGDGAELATALSAALAELSNEIAASVRSGGSAP
jgi:uncharacterized lipoprotein YmbA